MASAADTCESMDLSSQVAIVTGGAKGIGFASAECLLRLGASVMLVDWDSEAVSASAHTLMANSNTVGSLVADISSSAECQKTIAATVDRFGRLDILVNNAGIQTFGDP